MGYKADPFLLAAKRDEVQLLTPRGAQTVLVRTQHDTHYPTTRLIVVLACQECAHVG